MILFVICENGNTLDNELFIGFLKFGNNLLENGNQTVQKTVFNFFTSFSISEIFFCKFSQVIKKQIEDIDSFFKEKSNN